MKMYWPALAGEGRDVALHLLGREDHELADDVERVLRRARRRRGRPCRRRWSTTPSGRSAPGAAAVEDAHLVAGGDGELARAGSEIWPVPPMKRMLSAMRTPRSRRLRRALSSPRFLSSGSVVGMRPRKAT